MASGNHTLLVNSVLEKLGSGEFGTVHLGMWSNVSADPVQVAVKTLNSQCSESDRVKFLREAAIMGQFDNDNIVRLYGVVTEVRDAMIVLEYMPKGDLQQFLIDLKNKYVLIAINYSYLFIPALFETVLLLRYYMS